MKLPWPNRFLGYSPTPDNNSSALWEPITDRLIMISHHTDILTTLSKFTFRKFKSVVVNLDASIFASNLVDNDVCINWTLADSSPIALSEFHWKPVNVSRLVEVGPYHNWDLRAEQDFFMASHQILESLDGHFGIKILGLASHDWVQCYKVVNEVFQDTLLQSDKIELHALLRHSAIQIIFRSHTHQELDQLWYEVLERQHLVDEWGMGVELWNKK